MTNATSGDQRVGDPLRETTEAILDLAGIEEQAGQLAQDLRATLARLRKSARPTK